MEIGKKPKIWEHIAIKPQTYELFIKAKEESNLPPHFKTSDGFMKELLSVYENHQKTAKEPQED